jgi:hypothetical protein
LAEPPPVVSLSEPDAASQSVALRRSCGGDHGLLRDLLDCTVRLLFKPSALGPRSTHALKLRTHGVRAMDLDQATFPQVKNLLFYRDAQSGAASVVRILR